MLLLLKGFTDILIADITVEGRSILITDITAARP